jgi:hypothetical protein
MSAIITRADIEAAKQLGIRTIGELLKIIERRRS